MKADINETLQAGGDAAVRARLDEANKYSAINETLDVFDRWLIMPDPTPIYATLGTVAANLLPSDPVWLASSGRHRQQRPSFSTRFRSCHMFTKLRR